MSYYTTDGQQQYGPSTAEQLAGIAPDAQVWAEGWPEWREARTVPALAGALATVPPPVGASPSPPMPRRRAAARRRPFWVWVAAAAAGAALLFVVMRPTGVIKGEPGFAATTGSSPVSLWVSARNESQSPLIVKRVRVNGEADALPGRAYSDSVLYQGGKMPATVAIGETVYSVYHQMGEGGGGGIPKYPRDVVYVDVETNRGTFRWKDGRLQ